MFYCEVELSPDYQMLVGLLEVSHKDQEQVKVMRRKRNCIPFFLHFATLSNVLINDVCSTSPPGRL